MRYIGLDIHRDFAEGAVVGPGHPVRSWGRVGARLAELRAFAATLRPDDAVALEVTINTWAIAHLLGEHAGRVVVSNTYRTRAIAEAKIKTDKVDAAVLAQLLAADYLPSVWQPDDGPPGSLAAEPHSSSSGRGCATKSTRSSTGTSSVALPGPTHSGCAARPGFVSSCCRLTNSRRSRARSA